jgi:hypothetical protein
LILYAFDWKDGVNGGTRDSDLAMEEGALCDSFMSHGEPIRFNASSLFVNLQF